MSSAIVCAIWRATLWKKKISRAARIEWANGRPRSSLSLRARSSRGEGSLIVTTSSSSVGVLDIEFPRVLLYVLLACCLDPSNSRRRGDGVVLEAVLESVRLRVRKGRQYPHEFRDEGAERDPEQDGDAKGAFVLEKLATPPPGSVR